MQKAHKIEDILISFEKLIKLLKEHFEYEERLMKETKFEGHSFRRRYA
jgi:hemerythrin